MLRVIAILLALGGIGSIVIGSIDHSANDIIIGAWLTGTAILVFYRSRQLQSQAITLATPALILAMIGGIAIIGVFVMLAVHNSGIGSRVFFIAAASAVAAFMGYLLWQKRRANSGSASAS
ncbi:hypothetical protein EV642_12897 [Kribbella sp. VKM Ac-2500]|nr:hypothetical protein EV642_12897 [Kribbella sp. VKM Ac-2500]